MSASGGAVKFSEKEDSMNLMKNKSKTCIQPRFAKHTESSLRKIKIPIKLNKRSSTLEVKKLQETLSFSRLSGISKKQCKIMKQRQSMQALKTILKQEKQRRTSDLLQDNKLAGTICQPKQYAENLLVSLQGDLIKYSPKNCAKSPARSQALRHEVSSIRSLSVCPQDNIKNISDSSRDHTILNITCKLQSQSNNDEENFANSYCKIEVLRQKFKLEKPTEKSTEFIEPTNSIETIEPVESKKSTECIESAEFTELIKYTGFTESTEPTKPTETVEPTESKKSIECIESAESIEPIKFIESTESTKPIESIEYTKSTESIKYTDLTETTEPVEPKKSTECIESAEFTELIKSAVFTESIEPTKPTETVEPTESKKSIECIESAESIELIKFIESTESKKPIEHTDPTESIEPIKFTELTESTELTKSTELIELAQPAEDWFNNELEEQLLQQNISMNLSAATNYRELTQEILIKNKHGVKNKPNLKLARNSKFKTKHFDYSRNEDIKPIINSNVMLNQKKGVLPKNSVSTKTQRVWKPPSVKNSSHSEKMYMISPTQSILRKPSQLTKKYLSPTRDEYAESFDNELSAFILRNQCNEMKENKDPCVNNMTKICESLIELKQQQRVQNTGTSKKKKWANKADSKILKNYNDIPKSSKSESKSRHWQTRLVTPTRFSKTRNDIEQHHLDPNQISKKSKPLDVIHALKGIIKNMEEHEHADVNAVSVSKDGVLNREDTEFLTLPKKKTFSKITRKNNPRFTNYLNKANESVKKSHKSVKTQTTLNSSLHLEIDSNNGLDSEEILKKSTQTVAIQTSLCCNKSVVDVACNTTVCNVTCKNVGVFCDLVDSMKAKIDSVTIPNKKSVLEDNLIQTNKSLSAESVEIINAGDQCSHDNEIYLFNEETLSKMSLKLNDMENDAQCEDVAVPELEVENIPRQVIANFELTAERARNLYEAIIIYRSIMSRKFERRQEKYALVWNGSLEMNRRCNALAFPTATEKFSISRKNLLPFVYCILCIVLLWCLQFSFKFVFIM